MSRARLENLKSAADEMKSGRTWDTTPLNPPPADAAPEDTGVPPGGEAVGGFFHQPVKRLSSAVPAVRSLDERPNPRNISAETSASRQAPYHIATGANRSLSTPPNTGPRPTLIVQVRLYSPM